MRTVHNFSRPIRNHDLLRPVPEGIECIALHICECIWTMLGRVHANLLRNVLQNRSASITHNWAGGESRCAWIETTDTWQYLNILFRSLSRYQLWTLWRNRVAQDIFLIGYIVILPRILHHTSLGASFAFSVLISIVFHQEKSFDNDALFLIWKFVFWNQFDMVIFPLGATL